MPSIKFHVSRSITKPPELARQIHEALDMPAALPFFDIDIHMKWRQLTHRPMVAAYIGFLFNGEDGVLDAIQHLKDDLVYNKIFAHRRYHKGEDEESEVDDERIDKENI